MRVLLVAVIVVALNASARGQALTSEQGEEIIKQLRAINDALIRLGNVAPTPRTGPVSTTRLDSVGDFVLGRADAPVTIVEFSDLQCPFCSTFSSTTFPTLKERYIDRGLVKLHVRDFPLPTHKMAKTAAVAVRCASEQERFWDLRAALLRSARNLTAKSMEEAAVALKLDMNAISECLSSDRFGAAVERDIASGVSANISATPTFIIGKTAEPFEGELLVGAHPIGVFSSRIDAILANAARHQD